MPQPWYLLARLRLAQPTPRLGPGHSARSRGFARATTVQNPRIATAHPWGWFRCSAAKAPYLEAGRQRVRPKPGRGQDRPPRQATPDPSRRPLNRAVTTGSCPAPPTPHLPLRPAKGRAWSHPLSLQGRPSDRCPFRRLQQSTQSSIRDLAAPARAGQHPHPASHLPQLPEALLSAKLGPTQRRVLQPEQAFHLKQRTASQSQ